LRIYSANLCFIDSDKFRKKIKSDEAKILISNEFLSKRGVLSGKDAPVSALIITCWMLFLLQRHDNYSPVLRSIISMSKSSKHQGA
jgi:hypothetical protein